MKMLTGGGAFPNSHVSPANARGFAAAWDVDNGLSCEPCCSAENFKIDLLGNPRSPWNKSAAAVFAKDFISYHAAIPDNDADIFDEVMNVFLTRVKSLHLAYRDRLKSQELKNKIRQRARRNGRKYSVCFLTLCMRIRFEKHQSYSTDDSRLLRPILISTLASLCWNNWGSRECRVTNRTRKSLRGIPKTSQGNPSALFYARGGEHGKLASG